MMIAMLLCWPAVALDAATAPSSAPTSAPVTAPSDRSTPKAALKAFAHALDSGDRAKILEMLAVDTDQDRKLAGATADLAQASAHLRKGAIATFGEEKSRALGVDPTAAAAAAARLDAATESITGDTAVVRTADNEGPPMSLVRKAGAWLIPVGELSKDVEPADIDRNLADVAMQTGLMRALADEVAAGKFPTATDARQALDQRILRATMPALDAATQPATGPSRRAVPHQP